MAKQGIGTGSSPNDGTGDTLLTGAGKINDNFDEVYGVIGDGTTLFVGIVTQITAGTNVSISTAYGSVEVSAGSTANVRSDTLVVTGVSTLGIVTGATYYGDGSNLTGMANTSNVRTNSLNVSGVSTVASLNSTGVVTATSFVGSGVNLTGITTLIQAGDSISVTTDAGITTITSTAIASTSELRANTLSVTGVSTLGVVTGATYYGDATNITHSTWTLGAKDDNTAYTFTGPGVITGEYDPVIYLARGQNYEFVNNMGAHPFQIRESNGGNAFSTGITNNGVSNGTLRFEVPYIAPNTLYYQCTSHAGMGGTIVVYPNIFTV